MNQGVKRRALMKKTRGKISRVSVPLSRGQLRLNYKLWPKKTQLPRIPSNSQCGRLSGVSHDVVTKLSSFRLLHEKSLWAAYCHGKKHNLTLLKPNYM